MPGTPAAAGRRARGGVAFSPANEVKRYTETREERQDKQEAAARPLAMADQIRASQARAAAAATVETEPAATAVAPAPAAAAERPPRQAAKRAAALATPTEKPQAGDAEDAKRSLNFFLDRPF